MAELATLQVAASIIQIIDVGVRVAERLKEYNDRTNDLPDCFKQISNELPAYNSTLEQTKSAMEFMTDSARTALKPTVEGCYIQLKRLEITVDAALPKPGDTGRMRNWKAVASIKYDSEIKGMERAIKRYMDVMTYHHASSHTLQTLNCLKPTPIPTSTCPYPRDKDFVDREVMKDVEARCHSGSRLALAGIGGIGTDLWKTVADQYAISKSQIAIEFTHRVRQASPHTWVFWVDAKDVGSIELSFRKIAKAVKIQGLDEKGADILSLVRDWLADEINGPWVMVIDSADDTSVFTDPVNNNSQAGTPNDRSSPAQLREYLTISQNGSVLITSTNKEAAQTLTGNCAHHIKVEEMNESEALALLKSKLDERIMFTDDEAKQLVKAAEYMPLAISQTAGHISMAYPKFNLAQAIEKLNDPDQDATRFLEKEISESNRDSRRNNSVVKSWHSTFQYIRYKHSSAARLLSLMCLFDRQAIPEVLLAGQYKEEVTAALGPVQARRSWWKRLDRSRVRKSKHTVNHMAPVKDKYSAFRDDWRVLNNLMLIKTSPDGETFHMHRLIQHTTKRWLEINGEMAAWSTKFVSVIMRCFPSKPELDNTALCLFLFPHAQQVTRYRPTEQAAVQRWASLVYNIAQFAHYVGINSTSERLGRIAAECFEATLGQDHEITLQCVSDLGTALNRLRRYAEAEPMFRRIWECRVAVLGPDHDETLQSLYSLRSNLNSQKKWVESDRIANQIIEASERRYGPTHHETQTCLNGLIVGYMMVQRYESAEKLCRRVCRIQKEELGAESTANYQNMQKLAMFLVLQGKATEAERLLLEVLKVWEVKFSPYHSETIQCVNLLGEALTQQGKLEEAAKCCRRVVDIFEDLNGTLKHEALLSLLNLARVLSRQGRLEEAEVIAHQAVVEEAKRNGTLDCDIYECYHTLAEVLTAQKRFPEALGFSEKAYTGMHRDLGADHANTIKYLNDFNAAKNKVLAWPGSTDSSSLESEKVPKFLRVLSPMETCPSTGIYHGMSREHRGCT